MHDWPVPSPSILRAGALLVAGLCLVPAPSASRSPANCLPRETSEERTALLAGTTDDGADWVAGFGVDDRAIQLVCVSIILDGEEATRGVLGGPFEAAPDDGDVVVSVLTTGYRGGPRWHVIRGTVTAAAERVELSIDGAEPIEAQIADTGPEQGWSWYAAVVPAGEPGIPHVTATAFDADEVVIATGEIPS
jgi:hypothetical protein